MTHLTGGGVGMCTSLRCSISRSELEREMIFSLELWRLIAPRGELGDAAPLCGGEATIRGGEATGGGEATRGVSIVNA